MSGKLPASSGCLSCGASDATRVIHVVYGANAAYLQHTSVCIASLAESNRRHRITVHVLTCDREADAEDKLARTAEEYPNLSLLVHHVEASLLEGLFYERYFSKEVYLRMIAADIVPPDVNRILYLDSDTLVLDDIDELWRVDLEGNVLGAASDVDILGLSGDRFESIGLRPEDTYINSGVLLIDAARWRDEGISKRLIEYAHDRGSRLKFVDQDAINGALHRQIKVLDFRWNLQAISYGRRARRYYPEYFQETEAARRRPAILHFTSGSKPWNFRVWCNKKALYFQYLDKTAWRGTRPSGLSAAQRLEYDLARSLLNFGIDIYILRQVGAAVVERFGRILKSIPVARLLLPDGQSGQRSPSRGAE